MKPVDGWRSQDRRIERSRDQRAARLSAGLTWRWLCTRGKLRRVCAPEGKSCSGKSNSGCPCGAVLHHMGSSAPLVVRTDAGREAAVGTEASDPEKHGSGKLRNQVNPRVGSGAQQTRRAVMEQAVEAVGNSRGGTSGRVGIRPPKRWARAIASAAGVDITRLCRWRGDFEIPREEGSNLTFSSRSLFGAPRLVRKFEPARVGERDYRPGLHLPGLGLDPQPPLSPAQCSPTAGPW